MEIINSLISSKKGKLYVKFLIAAALLFTLAFALYTPAASPSASPAIATDANFSNANVSLGAATGQKGSQEGDAL